MGIPETLSLADMQYNPLSSRKLLIKILSSHAYKQQPKHLKTATLLVTKDQHLEMKVKLGNQYRSDLIIFTNKLLS